MKNYFNKCSHPSIKKGSFSRVRLSHCDADLLTLGLSPNVGTSIVYFVVVGDSITTFAIKTK